MRIVWSLAGAAATAAFVAAAAEAGTPWWAAALLWLAPDVALLAGMSREFADGRLAPRAVPLYNALHHLLGPALLGAAAVVGIVSPVLALAWLSHVTVDRALGFGLRTKEGLQRA